MENNNKELLDKIKAELDHVSGNIEKLKSFMISGRFDLLPLKHQAMLRIQLQAMFDYADMLSVLHANIGTDYNLGSVSGVSFSAALILLKAGFAIARDGWNGKGLMVFRQIPAHIDECVVPNMTSLPLEAKRQILKTGKGISYNAQCLIYNTNTGRADSWVPSSSDMMADDWMLVTD